LTVTDQPSSILIVEDNAALAANIHDFMEACGHMPRTAVDRDTASRLIQTIAGAGHRIRPAHD
jgi:DNA-binding response OmpR family regulator